METPESIVVGADHAAPVQIFTVPEPPMCVFVITQNDELVQDTLS